MASRDESRSADSWFSSFESSRGNLFLPGDATRLCRWFECHGCESPSASGDRGRALSWLERRKQDPSAMATLRRSAIECGDASSVSGSTDDQLLAVLADAIADGRLRICSRAPTPVGGAVGGGVAPAPPAPPPKPTPPPKPPPPPKPTPTVTVVINLSAAVACPGHPLPLTAVGTPGGGTFAWTIAGDGALVDAGGAPVATGASVNLRSFKADDATGAIPAQRATVSVTYTHPSGTATASKEVPIHAITFDVTSTAITAGVTQVIDRAGDAFFGNVPGTPTMKTDPQVKIKLDASCPRKAACASNHRVGWLQTMLTTDLRIFYTNTLISWSPPSMPIRDIITGAPTFPFYFWVTPFTADQQTQTAHHEDSPGNFGVAWTDSRAGAPAPPPATRLQLNRVVFKDTFTAWLVVQNVEWSTHDLPGSFAYQKHFDWDCGLDFAVDTTKPVAVGGGSNRCSPTSRPAHIDPMANGKGGSSPVLTAPVYNSTVTATTTAVP